MPQVRSSPAFPTYICVGSRQASRWANISREPAGQGCGRWSSVVGGRIADGGGRASTRGVQRRSHCPFRDERPGCPSHPREVSL